MLEANALRQRTVEGEAAAHRANADRAQHTGQSDAHQLTHALKQAERQAAAYRQVTFWRYLLSLFHRRP